MTSDLFICVNAHSFHCSIYSHITHGPDVTQEVEGDVVLFLVCLPWSKKGTAYTLASLL